MNYKRMPIEIESPEEMGYDNIQYNLAESSVRDLPFNELNIDLSNIVLAYGEHKGLTLLRQAIVAETQTLHPDDALVTTGAVMALFLVATTLLNKEDHLVVIRPNYATNLETPRAIGCQTTVIDLDFDNGYFLDPARVKAAIQPNTKLLSFTNPHNPTGKIFPKETIDALTSIAEAHDCFMILDETYRDLNFQTPLRPYAADLSEKVISICSFSKAFGAPGIRIGWALCKDKALMLKLLAAKEQIILGAPVIEEAVALHLLQQKQTFLAPIHRHVQRNFSVFKDWVAKHQLIECNMPDAGVVGFARLKPGLQFDFKGFSQSLFQDYQTVVGYGHWFEQPERYFRIGFGYPAADNLQQGLSRFDQCLHRFVV